jgi:hypothetical protein
MAQGEIGGEICCGSREIRVDAARLPLIELTRRVNAQLRANAVDFIEKRGRIGQDANPFSFRLTRPHDIRMTAAQLRSPAEWDAAA